MSLTQLITSTPDLAALADANDVKGLVAALNAKTIERTDHTLRGPALLTLALGQEIAAGVAYALRLAAAQDGPAGAYMEDIRAVYRVSGLDFAADEVRAGIDALVAGGLPAEVAAAVKGIGRWQESLYEQDTGVRGQDVTEELVAAAVVQRARQSLYRHQAERYNALVSAMDAGTVNSDDEAAAFFGGA